MNLATPERIRSLQRKLYCKAKADPAFRFYTLYDKICRPDILEHAYVLARANAGAPGVDGVTFATIEASGLEGWLAGLREELVTKTYRPLPVRRAMIPKPGGGERPLGIPTIRDRVAQTAAKLVLEPIFEADFEDSAYGYRPRRGAADAIKEVHRLICRGYTDVVDADLSKYFDTIPHSDLLRSVARRVVLSRGCAAEALAWTKAVMTKLGLTLNEAKTSLKDAREERFEFLGYTLGPHRRWKNGQPYLGASPSKKSVQRVKTKVGELLVPGNKAPWLQVRNQLNSLLSGWSAYFSYGTRVTAYRSVDAHVYDRVRHFLRKRHNMRGRGTSRFSYAVVYGELGVLRLSSACKGRSPCAIR